MDPLSDTYARSLVVPNAGIYLSDVGSSAEWLLGADLGDEIVEVVLRFDDAANPEAAQLLVEQGISAIGDDATALAAAQTALVIPAPVDPGSINHNDLASRSAADAHPASAITNTPAGNVSSATVQDAINELDTEKQPVDATLTALAGVTVAADKLIYATGSDTFTTTDLTAAARTVLDDASTSAMRTTLGLAIGTDVQAYDAELAALAGLTSAADKLPYFTGSGTAAVTDISATARTLIDDASTSAMRTTLGLGDSATLNVGTTAGTVAAGDDSRLIALTKLLDLYLWRFFPRGAGTQGWTSATSGSGTNFYISSPQYASEHRDDALIAWPMVSTGTTGSGTNARVAYPATYAQRYLYNDYRFVTRTMAVNAASCSIVRIGLWGNGLTPAATGRPTYGIWIEKDAATNGNSNWWLCAANGGAVSTDDTGIAFDATQRVWMFEFETTSSLKLWELVTSTSSEQASLTTGLPSGTTAQTCTEFWQVLSANTTPEGKFGPPNGDMGALRYDTGLEYLIPA